MGANCTCCLDRGKGPSVRTQSLNIPESARRSKSANNQNDKSFTASLDRGNEQDLQESEEIESKISSKELTQKISPTLIPKKNFRSFEKIKNIRSLYEFKKQLGSGSYGTVYEAINIKSGESRAIKVIQKRPENVKRWH